VLIPPHWNYFQYIMSKISPHISHFRLFQKNTLFFSTLILLTFIGMQPAKSSHFWATSVWSSWSSLFFHFI
jgi:hypothetical protein